MAMLLAVSTPGSAHDDSHARNPDDVGAEQIRVALEELSLVDIAGRELSFASEVIGDRIVAISFIYTSCTTVCPIISSIFAAVQDQLGDDLGPDVRLVSLSVDPTTDTPVRLAHYARGFEAGPDWFFLTGEDLVMARVLAGLGVYTPDFEDHTTMIVVGDGRERTWHRIYGYPSPDEIVEEIRQLLVDRGERADG